MTQPEAAGAFTHWHPSVFGLWCSQGTQIPRHQQSPACEQSWSGAIILERLVVIGCGRGGLRDKEWIQTRGDLGESRHCPCSFTGALEAVMSGAMGWPSRQRAQHIERCVQSRKDLVCFENESECDGGSGQNPSMK